MIVLIGLGLLGLVGYGDEITGPDIRFDLLYTIPVAIVTWYAGQRLGIAMSLASSLMWTVVAKTDGSVYRYPPFVYVNAVAVLGIFVVMAVLLSHWRTSGHRLEALVAERTAALRAEVERRDRDRKGLADLAAQLSAAEDAERRRIAYDIHDALSQTLSLVKLNLATMIAEAPSKPGVQDRLADLVRIVDDLIRQTRDLTFELHPTMLDDLGLVQTLHWYAGEFGRRAAVEVTVSEEGAARTLPAPLTHYLFRAVKELMSNSARHGNAKDIVAAVHWTAAGLRIVIDDDGSGFDWETVIAAPTGAGLGLPGITERIKFLGGEVRIDSRPGQGARVVLEVPVPA